jgi:hypothetical protein
VEDDIDATLGPRPVDVRGLPGDVGDLATRVAIEPVDRPGGVSRVTGLLEPAP